MPKAELNFKRAPDERTIIGFSGPMGAGKTTGALYLASEYGLDYVRYSHVLGNWLSVNTSDKPALQATGWRIMSEGLQRELNRRLIEIVRPSLKCAVDGLRHPIDEESLRSEFRAAFVLLYVEAPETVRWQRLRERRRFESIEDFRGADQHPVELPLRTLRAQAFRIVRNGGSSAAYYQALDRAMRDIMHGHAGGKQ